MYFSFETNFFRAAIGKPKPVYEIPNEPPKETLGFSGGTQMGEIPEMEYLADLQGEGGLEIYEKMRRSDGSVRAALTAVKLPILRALWSVEPVSERRKDREIAEKIEKYLFENEKDWRSTLREILSFLDFGFAVFEPEYTNSPEGTGLLKLGFRPQRTITKWKTDGSGNLIGIEQQVQVEGQTETVTMPIENLLIFSNEMEGKNWRGVSLLRTAYKHWKIKTRMENFSAISAERFSVGIPVVTLPEGSWRTEDRQIAQRIGRNLRSNEQAYIVKPAGFDVSILSVSGTRADLTPDIKYHEQQISKNVLAGFLDLGTSETGNRALVGELKEFFLLSLQVTSDFVTSIINRHLIPKITAWNFGESVEAPKLKVEKISGVNLKEWAEALSALKNAGLIRIDDELESFIRDVSGLPEIDLRARKTERLEQVQVQRPAELEPKPAEEEEKEEDQKAATRENCLCGAKRFGPDQPIDERIEIATDLERSVNWRKIASRQEKEDRAASELILEAQSGMISELLEKSSKLDLKKIERYEFDSEDTILKIASRLEAIFKFGQDQILEEVSKQKKKAIRVDFRKTGKRIDILSVAENLARIAIFKTVIRLKTSAATTVADSSWDRLSGAERKALLGERLGSLSDSLPEMYARAAIGASFSLGRDDMAQELLSDGKIAKVAVGSSILDGRLCDRCAEDIDGREFEIGTDEYDEHLPPYSRCEGGDRCRCVFIYEGI